MFANHLVDDYELTFRLLKRGYRIAFAPLSINYDEKPPTVDFMLRQRARWAKGFIDLLGSRIADRSDVIGYIFWLNPVAAMSGFIMLMVPAFAALHYLFYGYYPFTYAYLPLTTWFILTGSLFVLQATGTGERVRTTGFCLCYSDTPVLAILTILVCNFHQSIYHKVLGEYQDYTWVHEGNNSGKRVADAA